MSTRFLRNLILGLSFIIILFPPKTGAETGVETGRKLYLSHCASCHHKQRYGGSGPPLIPETLKKYSDEYLNEVITKGLPATNMPPFGAILDKGAVPNVVHFIRSPLKKPRWGMDEMLATSEVNSPLPKGPKHNHDLSNLFMVVEGGTGSVAIMDGKNFNVLDTVKVGAIHGGPKYDYSLRYSYMVSRDGHIVKYDLHHLKEVGRIRVAINTRNIAVSDDNRLLAVANYLPMNIVILDTETLRPLKIIDSDSRVGAVYNLKGKKTFIATIKGKPELWLIRYEGGLSVERLSIPESFDDLFLDPGGMFAIGSSRRGKALSVLDIKERKVVKVIDTDGMPHLASAALWKDEKGLYAAIPHIKRPALTILKLYDWEVVKTIDTKGPGFFARTHRNSDYIWVDTNTDTIQIIEKNSLKVVKNVIPQRGKKAMHIEFTNEGGYALVSVSEKEGAVVVYDNRTLEETKTIPFVKPVGKYNATNKNRPF